VKVRLALGCGAILVTGGLIAPPAAPTALATPQELVAPLLGEQAQLREVPLPFRGVQSVARQVREHIVGIPPLTSPLTAIRTDFSEAPESSPAAGFGVFATDTHVLTHALALDGRTTLQVSLSDGTVVDAEVAAFEPSTGLVLLQTTASGKSAAAVATALPGAGALGVGVGSWRQVDIAVPLFVVSGGIDRLSIGADHAVLPGMPLYNLEGELFAIAAGTDRSAAFVVAEAAKRLIARASPRRPVASLGIGLQELTEELIPAFGEKGVVISEVVEGGPAAQGGIQAGDLLVAIGATDVDSVDTATRIIRESSIDTATGVRVTRSGRARVIEVTPASAYEVAGIARTRAANAETSPVARDLWPAAVLDHAGIPPAARVLTIDGRAVSSRVQAQRLLRASRRPVAVLIRHDGNQFFAAIVPVR
jgi:S1-C subfamily serine protease